MEDFENKYILNNKIATQLIDILKGRCPLDSEYPKAQISSLYFDTPNLDLLKEKINSDFIKTKYRVRWYKDFHQGTAKGQCFLEVKSKWGEIRNKKRKLLEIPSTRMESISFNSDSFNDINNEFQLLKPSFSPLIPQYVVSYKRVRFKYPGTEIRFCLDFDINVPRMNNHLGALVNTNSKLANAVFEIKGPEEDLPEMMKIIETWGGQKNSFSKYLECYQMIKNIKEF